MKFSKRDWLIIGLLSCILVALIVSVAAVSYKIRDIELSVDDLAHVKQYVPKDGRNGIDGKIETIVTYLPGKDGQDATDEQVKRAVSEYFAAHPVQNGKDGNDGKNGQDGSPGRIVFVKLDEASKWVCQFAGDSGWQPVEECSQ